MSRFKIIQKKNYLSSDKAPRVLVIMRSAQNVAEI